MSTRPQDRQIAFDFTASLPTLPQLWTPDDIYSGCDEFTIRQFSEDNRVERKQATISQKLLAEYVVMWANTQPLGGVTFLGVDDSGEIIGFKNVEQQHLNNLEAVRVLCPDARIQFKRVAVRNRKGEPDFVLVMRVSYREDRLIETTDGTAFVREGDRKRRLTEPEKREVQLNKGQLDIEGERVTLRFPWDFDEELLLQYRSEYLLRRGLGDRYTLEDVLSMSKLGRSGPKGFEPNLGCALLFANDPRSVAPGAYIRILRYDGVEEHFGRRLNLLSDGLIEGPLPLQIERAEAYIELQIRNFTRLGQDGRFATKPEYPKEVWLEALINAVVHRSYNLKNMNIFVKKFEDKVVVESPGAFLPPTTPESRSRKLLSQRSRL